MLENLLQHFGYPALILGTFLEGEMSLLLAAYLALRGLLSIEWVIVCAFLGTYAADQLWYHLGRRHGRRILETRPRWQALSDKALVHLRRHPDLWVLGFRFFYGMRTVMPLAIGLSGYPRRRYMILDAIGTAIWAVVLGSLAYKLGRALEGMLDGLHQVQLYLFAVLAVLGLGLWLYRRRSRASR